MIPYDSGINTYQYPKSGIVAEPVEMTTYADTAAFTAEVAADPSAAGFLNCECEWILWHDNFADRLS